MTPHEQAVLRLLRHIRLLTGIIAGVAVLFLLAAIFPEAHLWILEHRFPVIPIVLLILVVFVGPIGFWMILRLFDRAGSQGDERGPVA